MRPFRTAVMVVMVSLALVSQANAQEASQQRSDDAGREFDRLATGVGVLGGGVLLLGAFAYTALRLEAIEDDPTLLRFRAFVPSTHDACAAARDGLNWGAPPAVMTEAASLCQEADTLEVAQYVFLIGGLVAGSIGTLMIADELAEDDAEPTPHVRLSPRVGPEGARLNATVTF